MGELVFRHSFLEPFQAIWETGLPSPSFPLGPWKVVLDAAQYPHGRLGGPQAEVDFVQLQCATVIVLMVNMY